MTIRTGALAIVAVLLFAAPSRAEVGLLSLEPLPNLIEVGASCSAGTYSAVTAVAAEAEPTSATLSDVPEAVAADPEILVADGATSPAMDAAEAALAPERFVDLREAETASLIAASLAPPEETVTGALRAELPATAVEDHEIISLETEAGSPGEGAEGPILP